MSKIIEMARQAGMRFSTTGSPTVAIELVSGHVRDLERFAALVGAAKKEECTKAIESTDVAKDLWAGCVIDDGPRTKADCADAIRALGDEVTG